MLWADAYSHSALLNSLEHSYNTRALMNLPDGLQERYEYVLPEPVRLGWIKGKGKRFRVKRLVRSALNRVQEIDGTKKWIIVRKQAQQCLLCAVEANKLCWPKLLQRLQFHTRLT